MFQSKEKMMQKLVEHQVADSTSQYFGAFAEGFGDDRRIGQFTMQESIITMQDYLKADRPKREIQMNFDGK